MRYRTILVIAPLMIPCGVRAQGTEKDAVLATVNKLFDGMRSRDTALLLSAFDTSARTVRVRERDGTSALTFLTLVRFSEAVVAAKPGDVWNERIYDPEVRIDGNLAQVWTYYTFHINDSFSHCGIDAFMLRKVGTIVEDHPAGGHPAQG